MSVRLSFVQKPKTFHNKRIFAAAAAAATVVVIVFPLKPPKLIPDKEQLDLAPVLAAMYE